MTKQHTRTWWTFCRLHPKTTEKNEKIGDISSDTKVDVLVELLTEKLDACSIEKHIECVSIIETGLKKRQSDAN